MGERERKEDEFGTGEGLREQGVQREKPLDNEKRGKKMKH